MWPLLTESTWGTGNYVVVTWNVYVLNCWTYLWTLCEVNVNFCISSWTFVDSIYRPSSIQLTPLPSSTSVFLRPPSTTRLPPFILFRHCVVLILFLCVLSRLHLDSPWFICFMFILILFAYYSIFLAYIVISAPCIYLLPFIKLFKTLLSVSWFLRASYRDILATPTRPLKKGILYFPAILMLMNFMNCTNFDLIFWCELIVDFVQRTRHELCPFSSGLKFSHVQVSRLKCKVCVDLNVYIRVLSYTALHNRVYSFRFVCLIVIWLFVIRYKCRLLLYLVIPMFMVRRILCIVIIVLLRQISQC